MAKLRVPYDGPGDNGTEAAPGRHRLLLAGILSPLVFPLLLPVLALVQHRPLPVFSAVIALVLYLVLLAAAWFVYRAIQYSLWSGIVLRYRDRFMKKAAGEEAQPPFACFSSAAEIRMVQEIVDDDAGYMAALERRTARAAFGWQMAEELLVPTGSGAGFTARLGRSYRKKRVAATAVGLVAVYFSGEEKMPFEGLGPLVDRLRAPLAELGGVLVHSVPGRLAAVFNGGWGGRETAVRTLKAARAVHAALGEAGLPRGCLVAADWLPALEGVLGTGPSVRYYLDGAAVARYLQAVPAARDNTLRLSARLIALVKGEGDAAKNRA